MLQLYQFFNFLELLLLLYYLLSCDNADDTISRLSSGQVQRSSIVLATMATLNKTNLIVNYLPQNLTDDEFRMLFQKFGNVTASKVTV